MVAFFQHLTVAFGVVAALVTLVFFVKFLASRKKLGRAVAVMLAGEFLTVTATLAFALITLGEIGQPSAVTEIVLRWSIFGATVGSTLYLHGVLSSEEATLSRRGARSDQLFGDLQREMEAAKETLDECVSVEPVESVPIHRSLSS